MTMQGPTGNQMTARTASVVYLAMYGGVAGMLVILAVLRTQVGGAPGADLALVLRGVGGGLLVAGIVLHQVLRRSVVGRRAGESEDAWWRNNGARVVVLWVQAEGLALVGGVFWYLTGDTVLLALVVVGVLTLAFSRPGRLAEL